MAVKTSSRVVTTATKSRVSRKEPAKSQSIAAKSKSEVSKSVKLSADEIEQRIRERAYYLYLNRGQADGQEQNDWAVAEQQIRRELNIR